MKNFITIIVTFLCVQLSYGQHESIKTQSVALEHFITFVVNEIERKSEGKEANIEHITFLIQTPAGDLSMEDKLVLKQAFKLISERLSSSDIISIVTYSGFNGIALNKTNAKELKLILYSLDNLRSSIKEFHNDGIQLAYTHANSNFDDTIENRLIMIRNPNATSLMATPTATPAHVPIQENNKKNNAVLLTAITLLPQIISVIKD